MGPKRKSREGLQTQGRSSSSTRSTGPQLLHPQLPDAVIDSILALVPLKQRLAVCTRVSRAWKAAVTALTTDLSIMEHPADSRSLDRWLAACGHQLTSLTLSQTGPRVTQYRFWLNLPCSSLIGLHSLTLEGYNFELCTTAKRGTRSTPAVAGMDVSSSLFQGLKQLRLLDCNIHIDTLEQLFLLRGLTCLNMSRCHIRPDVDQYDWFEFEEAEDWADNFAEWLEQLTDLRSLTLHDICGPPYPVVLEAFGALTQLQHLSLDQEFDGWHGCDPIGGPITCPYLADSLTSLAFIGSRVEVSPATVPTLSRLTALQQLSMGRAARLDPNSLASLPQLRALELDGCTLLEHAVGQRLPKPYHEYYDGAIPSGLILYFKHDDLKIARAQVAVLFHQLPSLTRLESLTLSHIWALKEQPLQSFEALTASSHLTALRFEKQEGNCCTSVGGLDIEEDLDMPLPRGALLHMFPKGKQLPQLQLLRIAYMGRSCQLVTTERQPIRRPTPYKVSVKERNAIKAACPGLQDYRSS